MFRGRVAVINERRNHIASGLRIDGSARVECPLLPKRRGKLAYHSIEAMERRRDGSGRTANPKRYRELVVDCRTGKAKVDVDESLADHLVGHGSAGSPD